MNFTLKIWRQKDAKAKGAFETYKVENISADTSFLEMLDILNNNLIHEGKEPVAFDHDCREGICGMCSLHIDGRAHGPGDGATTCQIYMRRFKDGATIVIEPWRSAAFPVIKDLGPYECRAGCQQHSHPEGRCRRCDGCRCLHRLRCLRCDL